MCSRKKGGREEEGPSPLDLATSIRKYNLSSVPCIFPFRSPWPEPNTIVLALKKANTTGNSIAMAEHTSHVPSPGTGTLPLEINFSYRKKEELCISFAV